MRPPFRSVRRGVLVDSSGYFALADAGDIDHAVALAVARMLMATRWSLITTNFIVAETYGLVLTRRGRAFAWRFLQELDQSNTMVIRATEDDERRAREIIRQYDDKDFSFVDTMSFAVMERLGINQAFTFDRHFAQYGFVMLDDAAGV